MYPFETYEIPQNPNELEYRIENSREQKIKEYDFFISHSSKDGTIVQKLIRAENQNGKNIFCDWINDVDYLKRELYNKVSKISDDNLVDFSMNTSEFKEKVSAIPCLMIKNISITPLYLSISAVLIFLIHIV